jgi:hypothetical protein
MKKVHLQICWNIHVLCTCLPNLLEHPCIVHMFTKFIVTASLLHQAPWYKGMQAFCNVARLSTLSSSTSLGCSGPRSTCGCSISRGSSLGLASTYPPISSMISQACCTSLATIILAAVGIMIGEFNGPFNPIGMHYLANIPHLCPHPIMGPH